MTSDNATRDSFNRCRACASLSLRPAIDFGMQPVSNRFLSSRLDEEELFQLILGICSVCATAQLINPPPPAVVRPRYNWISYSEPCRHLDDVIDQIAGLDGLRRDDLVVGLSLNDAPVLDRLAETGYTNALRLDMEKDMGIENSLAGVETIQERLSDCAAIIKDRYGSAKLLIARFILEHAHNVGKFLSALKDMIAPDGYVLLEVPDCARAFSNYDYSFIWEEHVMYFTERTLLRTLKEAEFIPVMVRSYLDPHENTMSVLAGTNTSARAQSSRAASASDLLRHGHPPCATGTASVMQEEFDMVENYRCQFPRMKHLHQELFSSWSKERQRLGVFGAGHQTISFVNLLDLKNFIDIVIDDNQCKQGLFMPGSRLPIEGSAVLERGVLDICILGLGSRAEAAVLQKHKKFLESSGGRMYSLVRASKRALRLQSEDCVNARA